MTEKGTIESVPISLGPGAAAIRRIETLEPRPDFIGGTTPQERRENRDEVYHALKEMAVAAVASYRRRHPLTSG